MHLRLRVLGEHASSEDVVISCTPSVSVSEVARALQHRCDRRAGQDRSAVTHRGPVTLVCRPVDGNDAHVVDPGAALESSGIQSGWEVRILHEFDAAARLPRSTPIVGTVEVLDGVERGHRFSLTAGTNRVGRGAHNRVRIGDRSVSRTHCVIELRDRAVIRDLASVNGITADGVRCQSVALPAPGARVVRVGDISLRVRVDGTWSPSHQIPKASAPAGQISYTPPPRVIATFAPVEHLLPRPPEHTASSRAPLVAMLAPAVLGIAMWMVTGSTTSLVFAALSPLLAGSAWMAERLRGRTQTRRSEAEFQRTLARERRVLTDAREQEVDARSAEAPSAQEIVHAAQHRTRVLWTRRTEHGAFLSVRFGTGRSTSRTTCTVPEGGPQTQHDQLQRLADDFATVECVPIVEQLSSAGSIAVCGPEETMYGIARALVLQLIGLHAPSDVRVVCFADAARASQWAWLGWAPHVEMTAGPPMTPHLADTDDGAAALVAALECEVERRAGKTAPAAPTARFAPASDAGDVPGAAVGGAGTAPAIVVLVLSDVHVARARLIRLAEHGPEFGVHLVWCAASSSAVPAACRTYVECDTESCRVGSVLAGLTTPLERAESIDIETAELTARRLAPLNAANNLLETRNELADTVALRDLHEVDLTAGSDAILRGWRATGSVRADWSPGRQRVPAALAATLGQGTDGPLRIDLRADGPHALVGGTTGSGKSDFLQTWVISLAASLSPEQVTFLLFDFKGGAAFADCALLPHTVGMVTDLSSHLADRVLKSLRAELRYREGLLAESGAKDLLTLERDSDVTAPPALVIVIDEFATVANEVPEFIDGIVDIAQRGRSLGLHLIMATQRPAGVITENVRANTRIRIALRMADDRESRDVIESPVASRISVTTPGRATVRLGRDAPVQFQTGHLGAVAQSSETGFDIHVARLGFSSRSLLVDASASASAPEEHRTTDLQRVVHAVRAAAEGARVRRARRPWLEPLPAELSMDTLHPRVPRDVEQGVLVGLVDVPEEQCQSALTLDLCAVGHIAILGASGTGKTSALVTSACELSRSSTTSHPVEIYGIDATGGSLHGLGPLPSVGAIASLSNLELVSRILERLCRVLDEPPTGHVRAVLLIDGFAAFREAAASSAVPAPWDLPFAEILSRGRAAGVHVILTADRPGAIPAAFAASIQRRFVLRLVSESDSALLGLSADAMTGAPPGRGIIAGSQEEFQFASLAPQAGNEALSRSVARRAAELERAGVPRATRLHNAPRCIALGALPVTHDGGPVIGIETTAMTPVSMPTAGLALIVGPPASGVTTALDTCVRAWVRWCHEHGTTADTVLLTFGRSALRESCQWTRCAMGEQQIGDLVDELLTDVSGSDAERTSETLHSRRLIVVERAMDCDDDRVLARLALLARRVKRSGAMMLVECDPKALPHPLSAAVRHPRWGISLKPDPLDGSGPFRESFPRRIRREEPVGRGLLIHAGSVVVVQVALAADTTRGEHERAARHS